MDPCAFDMLFTRSVPNILEKIFLSLDYKSFKACLDVSKTWNELLTADSYRAKGKLVFHAELLQEEKKLWNAVIYGNTGKVKNLLSTGMLNVNYVRGCDFRTPLLEAAYYGQKDVVQLLLDRGADPNKEDAYGWTPLSETQRCGPDVVQLLLDRGADPKKTGLCGLTPLHEAVINNQKDVVKMLLNAGAEVDTADAFGRTPLYCALECMAMYGNKEVVLLLLRKGADHNKPCKDGVSPLRMAEKRGHYDIVQMLREEGGKKGRV